MESFGIQIPNFYPNRRRVNLNLEFDSGILKKRIHFFSPCWLQSLVVVSGLIIITELP